MKYKIPFIKPAFPRAEDLFKDYKAIVESNWYTNFGPYEKEFSSQLESFVGQDVHVATVSNATLGLVTALAATLGKGDGSKYVLMPSFTFVAGAQALIWCGYKPYFLDIDANTLQMDATLARDVIERYGSSIKGVLFCNAFGVGDPNIQEWEDIAAEYQLPLVIDSAAGFGSKYVDGNYLGARGDCEVFSFHATKPFAVGEGGAVTSRNSGLIKKIRAIQNFGFDNTQSSQFLGLNAKLQEFNAAIGLRQLEFFENRLKSRQDSYSIYINGLSDNFKFQENAGSSSLCFASVVCNEVHLRNHLIEKLIKNGVEAKKYYNLPIHMQSYFDRNRNLWKASDLEVTKIVSESILSLPIHDHMEKSDVGLINQQIREGASG